MRTKCWCQGNLKPSVHPLYGECEQCGTLVLRQEFTPEQLHGFYSFNEYWHAQQAKAGYPAIEQRAKDDLGNRIPHWYNLIRKHNPGAATMLEIGCCHGAFLDYCADRNMLATGIEPDEKTCAWARINTYNRHRIISGLFPDCASELLPYRYDAVCGFDVLEHMPEPLKAMETVRNLMSHGGICIFQTPCYCGEDKDWPQFRPEEHLFLFNKKSIAMLLCAAGIKPITVLDGFFEHDMTVVGEIHG